MTHMDFVDGHPVHSDRLRDGDGDRASHMVCHFSRFEGSLHDAVRSISKVRQMSHLLDFVSDLVKGHQKRSHFTIVKIGRLS